MEELWFNGDPLKTSGPSIGQFLNHVENHLDITNQEKSAYAISHLTPSIMDDIAYCLQGKWQDLRKVLFQKYQSKVSTLMEKINLRKSLIQSESETCQQFYNRCVKIQYLLHDDVGDLICKNDIVFSFVIGLKVDIHEQLILHENLSSLDECLNIAIDIEKNLHLQKSDTSWQQPLQLEEKAIKNEYEDNKTESVDVFGKDSRILSETVQNNEGLDGINGNYANEIACDNDDIAKDTCSQETKVLHKSDSENNTNTHTVSDDSFKHANDDKADLENDIPVHGVENAPKIKPSPMIALESKKECSICGKEFELFKDLDKHFAENHENESLKCKYCSSSYRNRDRLRRHLKNVHNVNNKIKIKCAQCPMESTYKRTEAQHAIHVNLEHPKLDPKLGKRLCQICDDSNETFVPAALERHIKLRHFNEECKTCDQCAKQFLTQVELRKHQKKAHERKITCDICKKEFENKLGWYNTLSSHKKNEHGNEKEDLDCTVCKKSFKQKLHLKKHLTYHHGPKNYTCDSCGKSFATNWLLNDHSITHLEKTVPCPVKGCGLKVQTELKLRQHIYDCHKKKKELKYHCHECPKIYDQPGKLKLHVAVIHRGERPFKCLMCDFTSTAPNSLREHKQTVHEGVMFPCKYCSKQFNRISTLNTHAKSFHGILKPAERNAVRRRILIE